MTLREAVDQAGGWNFSRIPIFKAADPEHWKGYLLSRDVLAGIAQENSSHPISTLIKPLHFVSLATPGHKLLKAFLKRRTHIFGVIGSDGKVAGIVTLEDVLESIIGAEIVDELDIVVDMQDLAPPQPDTSI